MIEREPKAASSASRRGWLIQLVSSAIRSRNSSPRAGSMPSNTERMTTSMLIACICGHSSKGSSVGQPATFSRAIWLIIAP